MENLKILLIKKHLHENVYRIFNISLLSMCSNLLRLNDVPRTTRIFCSKIVICSQFLSVLNILLIIYYKYLFIYIFYKYIIKYNSLFQYIKYLIFIQAKQIINLLLLNNFDPVIWSLVMVRNQRKWLNERNYQNWCLKWRECVNRCTISQMAHNRGVKTIGVTTLMGNICIRTNKQTQTCLLSPRRIIEESWANIDSTAVHNLPLLIKTSLAAIQAKGAAGRSKI